MVKKEFTASQVGAMIEQFQSQFKVFGESLTAIQQKTDKIDGLMEMVAQNTEDIEMLKIIAKATGRDVKSLHRKVDHLSADMPHVKQELKHKANRDEVQTLHERISVLET